MKISRFEDIEAWQLARELTKKYISSKDEFDGTYEQARRTRAAIRGFINYLDKHKSRAKNPTVEP